MVLPDRFELPTSALQVRRTTNCAKGALPTRLGIDKELGAPVIRRKRTQSPCVLVLVTFIQLGLGRRFSHPGEFMKTVWILDAARSLEAAWHRKKDPIA